MFTVTAIYAAITFGYRLDICRICCKYIEHESVGSSGTEKRVNAISASNENPGILQNRCLSDANCSQQEPPSVSRVKSSAGSCLMPERLRFDVQWKYDILFAYPPSFL